jgi:hypothetical protein
MTSRSRRTVRSGLLALGACLQIAACTPNHAIQEISLASTTIRAGTTS